MQIGGPQHPATDDSAEILLLDGAKALAHRRGVSLRTLRRQFSSLGTTLSDFISARRAALTMNLLQRPGTRMRDAARALGFSGDVSFVHFVKREFGKTPGALRDELSPGPPLVPPGASEDDRAPRGSRT
ncbi:MAG TPA: helix-turn-helix domain-containing protein [Thermoanaerobaculia bacterium]|nr:helix-turn-helix domain-containing protein [Thermoanaerobaculia bacterium]